MGNADVAMDHNVTNLFFILFHSKVTWTVSVVVFGSILTVVENLMSQSYQWWRPLQWYINTNFNNGHYDNQTYLWLHMCMCLNKLLLSMMLLMVNQFSVVCPLHRLGATTLYRGRCPWHGKPPPAQRSVLPQVLHLLQPGTALGAAWKNCFLNGSRGTFFCRWTSMVAYW